MPGPRKPTPRSTKRAAPPSFGRRFAGAAFSGAALAARPIGARPVLSASLAAFAVFSGIVATNALTAQAGRHARPILATRGDAPAAVAETADEAGTPGLSVPLVEEVQTALAAAGYYTAAIDGRPGKATSAAIRRFQSERGLSVDGEASPRLLAALRKGSETPERVASLEADPAVSANDARPSHGAPADAMPQRELVRLIQEGMSSAGIASLTADGIMGRQTESAIRSFQASQGLDVTGAPDETVLERLQTIVAERR